MLSSKKRSARYLALNLSSVFGIVLVWRGIWYLLDELDYALFAGTHTISALLGIILGILVLYLPERNLRALEKL
jgi:hypothetical protein